MSYTKFWLDAGLYTVEELEIILVQCKDAINVADKTYTKHIAEAMGEVKELIKKASEK